MYILYLDDSGSVGNATEEYFVLGGLAVPETSVRWLSHQLDTIACTLSASNPSGTELHAAEIFRGRMAPWKEMSKAERITAIQRVLSVLDNANADIAAFACAVHKASYRGRDPVQMAFEELSSRFDKFLKHKVPSGVNGPKGIVVLDKSSYETNLQTLAADFRREGNRWGSYLTNICEVPLFVDSTASRNIQLADHIAYAVFRRYNAGDLAYFNCIEDRFDQDASTGAIYGLVHRHAMKRNCTCPACLTRRESVRGGACN